MTRRIFCWLLTGLFAVGCSGGDAARACGQEERPPEQSGGHLIGDAGPPRPYNSVPPTSGWHSAGAPRYGVHDEPLTEPEQVTVLELGGVVLSHGEIPAEERAELEAIARRHERVAVTPYDRLKTGEVAMAAWGVLRRCDGVHLDTIARFVDAHAGTGREH